MKPTLVAALFTLISAISLSANAQARTYTPINSSFSSNIYGSGTICTNCDLVLAPGVTITINSNCGCDNCTFVGGTVLITTGSNFTLSGVDSFVDESVTLNQQFSDSSLTFYGAKVSVTTPITLTGVKTVIDSSKFSIGSSLTLGQTTVAKSTLNLSNAATLKFNSNLTSSGSSYNLAGTSTINSTANTNLSSDTVTMSGSTNSFTSGYTLTTANTDFTLNSTSSGTLTASQGYNATGGAITAATGSTISSAYAATFYRTAINLTGTTFTASQGFTTSGTGSTFNATSSTIAGSGGAVSLDSTATSITSSTLTAQSLTTSVGTFKATSSTITSTDAISLNSTADTLVSSTYSGQSISTSGGTFYVNASNVTSTFGATFVNTPARLIGNTNFTAQQLSLQTNTWFAIGDGTLGSSGTSARVNLTFSASEDATSTLAIANNNNYLQSSATGAVSCGGAAPQHACATGYIYGCATIKNSGAPVGCTLLAEASISLSAAVVSPGQVALTWTDNETANAADHYTIQRNTGNNEWTNIGTTAAGSTTGDYYFKDANAPDGTVDYRIQRTDADGNIGYSAIASVTVALAGSQLSIYPNPAIGGRFYINTPYTGEMVVNVYTSTGQLLLHTSLQGQTQYSIQLPQQNLSMSAVVVQTISQNANGAFTLLVR
jgi:hypothetical protein